MESWHVLTAFRRRSTTDFYNFTDSYNFEEMARYRS